MCVPSYGGRLGTDEALRLEAAPVAEPDEDEVADRGGDEPRQDHGQEGRAHRQPALHHEQAADERAAEERGDRGERPGRRKHRLLALVCAVEERHRHPHDGSERDERRFGAEHSAERQRAEAR